MAELPTEETEELKATVTEPMEPQSEESNQEGADGVAEIPMQEVQMNQMPKSEPPHRKKAKAKELLKKKDEEIKELKDQLLRKQAEFENFRKRLEKEKADFVKFALSESMKDFLPILDSFDRALHPDHMTDETRQVFEGFTLIYKQMMDFIGKQGVEEISTEGETFDPNYHMAVSKEAKEGVASGKILTEYQKGYTFNNRVLRASMVVVAE